MARQARNETEAGVWHVWARGVERRSIFGDDEDRRLYFGLLRGVVERFRWRCLAYCQMTTHVHLVIETREPNLGRGMHALHGTYAQAFNERWSRVGHLFQSRYGSRVLHDEAQLAIVLGYVAANPVTAGLCARPEEWPWGSHRAGLANDRHPILDLARVRGHMAALGEPLAVYNAFVEARLVNGGLPLPA